MIIGFLGKGGSGKSTLSYRFIRFLESQGKYVLAIDADHNMDMLYNFSIDPEKLRYIGQGLTDLKKYAGLSEEQHYSDIFHSSKEPVFSINSPDAFTEQYSIQISKHLRIMATGPHTDDVLYDKSCSHILTTPLKSYLPYLALGENEFAVVDEKAGTDSVGTGITTGFDVAVIVFEPTLHSIKAGKQIATLLEFYETPYIFAGNKVMSANDHHFIEKNLGSKPEVTISFDTNLTRPELTTDLTTDFQKLLHTLEMRKSPRSRLERSKLKFSRNNEYKKATMDH